MFQCDGGLTAFVNQNTFNAFKIVFVFFFLRGGAYGNMLILALKEKENSLVIYAYICKW